MNFSSYVQRLSLCSVSAFLAISSAHATTFNALDVFGDSTVDSGWWAGALAVPAQCGGGVASPCASGDSVFDTKVKAAIAAGGTGAPVGVGLMNTQILATMLGVTANPANQPGGTDYAISGSKDAASGSPALGNLHSNPNLPSTVQQIANYLTQNGGVANPNSLYLVSSGGNDITYANTPSSGFTSLTDKQNYLSTQITSLVSSIQTLQSLGAQHILINNLYGTNILDTFYNTTLIAELAAAHVNYTLADVALLVQTVEANPTAYGFTAGTVLPGVAGQLDPSSACAAGAGASGWGQFCGNTTHPNPNFSNLRSSNSEQTSFFSDDQHFSAAGQAIEAQFDFDLVEGVPEPSTWAMLLLGFAGIGFAARGRRSLISHRDDERECSRHDAKTSIRRKTGPIRAC
jgi:outer membrane lipase/esterase